VGSSIGPSDAEFIVGYSQRWRQTYLVPNFQTGQEDRTRFYTGWDGVKAEYISPAPEKIKKPALGQYLEEWNTLRNGKLL
jgi:lysine 2,3-aminomutase